MRLQFLIVSSTEKKKIDLLYRAARAQAVLVQEIPSAVVEVEQGELVVYIKGFGDFMGGEQKLAAKVEEITDEKGDLKVRVRLTSQ